MKIKAASSEETETANDSSITDCGLPHLSTNNNNDAQRKS